MCQTMKRKIIPTHLNCAAPLTSEEIAAIDEAGSKGPPSQLLVAKQTMQHRFERAPLLCIMLVVAVMFSLITFFTFWRCMGDMQ
jgi:hypothetical protein